MRTRALNSADVRRSLRRLDRKREELLPRYAARCVGSRLPGIPRARSRKVYSSRYRQKFLSDCEGFLRRGVFGILRTISVVCTTLPRHAVLRAAVVDAHRITRCTIDALRHVLKSDPLGGGQPKPSREAHSGSRWRSRSGRRFGTRGPVAWVSGELAYLVMTGAFNSSMPRAFQGWAFRLVTSGCGRRASELRPIASDRFRQSRCGRDGRRSHFSLADLPLSLTRGTCTRSRRH